MITIIKEGKIKHRATCDQCDCVFTFTAEDVTEVTVWDDHGGHYPAASFYKIDCPCCHKKLNLSDNFNQDEVNIMAHIDD